MIFFILLNIFYFILLMRGFIVFIWQRQWLHFVEKIQYALIYDKKFNEYPDVNTMLYCIYSYMEMILYFWKSPKDMIADKEIYNIVLELGKKYNIKPE